MLGGGRYTARVSELLEALELHHAPAAKTLCAVDVELASDASAAVLAPSPADPGRVLCELHKVRLESPDGRLLVDRIRPPGCCGRGLVVLGRGGCS
jgi:hypothetical protein